MGLSFTCTASSVHLINSNDWSIKWLLNTEAAPDVPLWLPQAGFWQQPTCFLQEQEEDSRAGSEGIRATIHLLNLELWKEDFVHAHPATVYRPPASISPHFNSEPLLYRCSQCLPRKPCCSFLLPWHEFSVIYPISTLSDFVLEIPSPIQLSVCMHTYKNTHTHKHTPHPISSPYSLPSLITNKHSIFHLFIPCLPIYNISFRKARIFFNIV